MTNQAIITASIYYMVNVKNIELWEDIVQPANKFYLKCVKGPYSYEAINEKGMIVFEQRGTFKSFPDDVWTKNIDTCEVNEIISNLCGSKIRTDFTEAESNCLDVNGYKIRFRDFFENKEFIWWESCPKEWELLENILDRLNSIAGCGKTYDF